MRRLKRGILVAIEGIDGSGKSTLIKNLAEHFTPLMPTFSTKEPGATALGKQLRTLLQEQPNPLCSKAEYLLFAADRAQHFAQVIVPLLDQQYLILSDRMADSSVVYQGYGRGLDKTMLSTINAWAMEHHMPDVTLYVAIDPQIARERLIKRGNLSAFEKDDTFIQTLAQGFEDLFKKRTNVIRLQGELAPLALTQHALQSLMSWIEHHNLFVP